MTRIWLIDFDDTLASGPVTWGYQRALPKVIERYDLPVDREILEASLLVAQEQANQTTDLRAILDELFAAMGWPSALQQPLLQDVQENYRPELFDDARPFLEALHASDQTVFILSNNPRTPVHAGELGLLPLAQAVVTPHMLPGSSPKPSRTFWDRFVERFPGVEAEHTVIVGDDPWSDLAFAEACGLEAWLLDRHDRFAALAMNPKAQRVRSLLEIPTA